MHFLDTYYVLCLPAYIDHHLLRDWAFLAVTFRVGIVTSKQNTLTNKKGGVKR